MNLEIARLKQAYCRGLLRKSTIKLSPADQMFRLALEVSMDGKAPVNIHQWQMLFDDVDRRLNDLFVEYSTPTLALVG